MGRRVMRRVHVRDDEGNKYTFDPGEEVPDHLEQFITHVGVWLGEGEFQPEPKEEDSLEVLDELSKLSVRQLAKLAYDKNVEMPDNAKKADLLQALRDAGVTSIG